MILAAIVCDYDFKRAPDGFSNLDEYIYEPKSTVRFGFRYVSGAKTSFSGQGRIPSPEDPGAAMRILEDLQALEGSLAIVEAGGGDREGVSSVRNCGGRLSVSEAGRFGRKGDCGRQYACH